MTAGVSELTTVIFVVLIGLYIFCWWRIWTKAGFHGAWSLLMIFPPLSLIALIYIAFADWPNAKSRR